MSAPRLDVDAREYVAHCLKWLASRLTPSAIRELRLASKENASLLQVLALRSVLFPKSQMWRMVFEAFGFLADNLSPREQRWFGEIIERQPDLFKAELDDLLDSKIRQYEIASTADERDT